MLRMDGTRPTVMPTTTLSSVDLCCHTGTTPRFLDQEDDATVRAFSTRTRRTAGRSAADTSWRPSYRQMKAQSVWHRVHGWSRPSGRGMVGLASLLTVAAFAAGVTAHWTLTL